MKCDVDHQLISFNTKDCPLCKLKDESLELVYQVEQLVMELEDIFKLKKKKGTSAVKTVKSKTKTTGKLLRFPRPVTATPNDAA